MIGSILPVRVIYRVFLTDDCVSGYRDPNEAVGFSRLLRLQENQPAFSPSTNPDRGLHHHTEPEPESRPTVPEPEPEPERGRRVSGPEPAPHTNDDGEHIDVVADRLRKPPLQSSALRCL